MKKIFRISALLMILPLVATSCFKMEEDDLFEKSAAERLNAKAGEYADILTAQGGKWQMEYYANDYMPGFVYIMTFRNDGTVRVAGENVYIGAVDKANGSTEMKYGYDDSQWDIITDNGPVLSFSSYNKYFHLFSRPDDFLNTSNGTGNDGRGMEGDYEFILLKYSGDTLYLKGKKREMELLMTRLPEDTDDKAYLDQVVANANKFFSSLIPRVFLTYPNGDRYVITNGASLVMNMYEESSPDPLTTSFTRNGIIGHDTFAFMNPLEYNGFTVHHFKQQEDGTLLCLEDNTSTISAGDLAKDCFTDTLQTWSLALKDIKGDIKTVADQVQAQVSKLSDRETTEARDTTVLIPNVNTTDGKPDSLKCYYQMKLKNTYKLFSVDFGYLGYPAQKYYGSVLYLKTSSGTVAYYYDKDCKKSVKYDSGSSKGKTVTQVANTTSPMKVTYINEFTFPAEHQLQFNLQGIAPDDTNSQQNLIKFPGSDDLIRAIFNGAYRLVPSGTATYLAPYEMNFTSTSNPDNSFKVKVK